MKGGVGFASSVTQTKAAQAKKEKRRAAIPTTPAIEATVAKIRQGKPLNEPDPDIKAVRECWQEIVKEMRLVRRDMRARQLEQAAKVAVRERPVLETIVLVSDGEPALVAKPSPLPEKVEIEPLLLTARAISVIQRQTERSILFFKRMKLPCETPATIYLPSYFGGDFAAEAAAQKQQTRDRRTLEQYDAGKLDTEDFAPELPPELKPVPVDFKQVSKPYQYHGGYYSPYFMAGKG